MCVLNKKKDDLEYLNIKFLAPIIKNLTLKKYNMIYSQQNTQAEEPSLSPKDPIHLKFNVSSEVAGMIKNAKNNLDK